MRRYACLIILALALPTSARADRCSDYRQAIDAYIEVSDARAAVEKALEAARSGIRAARANRNAIKALNEETTLEIVKGADAVRALEAADVTSTLSAEAFEAVYSRVKEATADLGEANAATLEEARIEADEAADAALDVVSKFKAVTRKAALRAASTTARASPGAMTSRALVAAYENIFRAACE